MTTKEALEIKKALFTISDFLEIDPLELINSICVLNKQRYSKLKKASDIWNEFDDADNFNKWQMLSLNASH